MANMISLTSFVLFDFILELFDIFMVMNIAKVEQINATGNCLQNNFFLKNFCLPQKLYLTQLVFIGSKPRL